MRQTKVITIVKKFVFVHMLNFYKTLILNLIDLSYTFILCLGVTESFIFLISKEIDSKEKDYYFALVKVAVSGLGQ